MINEDDTIFESDFVLELEIQSAFYILFQFDGLTIKSHRLYR